MSFAIAIGLIVLIVGAMLVLLAAPNLAPHGALRWPIAVLRWPVALVLLGAAIALLVRFGPADLVLTTYLYVSAIIFFVGVHLDELLRRSSRDANGVRGAVRSFARGGEPAAVRAAGTRDPALTTSTGRSAWCTTARETLPRIAPANGPSPREPTMIRSASQLRATSRIISAGSPSMTSASAGTPAASASASAASTAGLSFARTSVSRRW